MDRQVVNGRLLDYWRKVREEIWAEYAEEVGCLDDGAIARPNTARHWWSRPHCQRF